MGRIVSLFARLDAAIQIRFDSICFSLMRRYSIRKSTIRYVVIAVLIASTIGILVSRVQNGRAAEQLSIQLVAFVIVMVIAQHSSQAADTRAERNPGTESAADTYLLRGPIGRVLVACAKVTVWLGLILTFLSIALEPDGVTFLNICMAAYYVSYLSAIYLLRTPMNPPAEKTRERASPSHAAPAKA